MKFGVLALDYDGTIAIDGALDPDVRAAIAEVRSAGVVVVLVTGRILDDLRRVAGDLRFVDAVVTENGAVLAYPASGHSMVLGSPPPERFVKELRQRGIDITLGACVVEAHAADAHAVLTLVREMELPLVLLFNRGRLMILPETVSKRQAFGKHWRACVSRHTTPSRSSMPRTITGCWRSARSVSPWPGEARR